MTDKTGRGRHEGASPDQNDPTGRTRSGSPTYTPADPPANNHRVGPRDRVAVENPATAEDAEEEAKRSNEPLRHGSNVG